MNETLEVDPYIEFLENKRKTHTLSGFDVAIEDLNKSLFPFQKFCVQRALKAGRYAFFQDCGLGKTIQQLDWASKVADYSNGWVLILAPLAVKAQTIKEGKKFNIYVQDYFEAVKNNDINNLTQGILIANYEQLENIECFRFNGVVLDESSICKSFDGATYKKLCDLFYSTPYKLCCTATPSPNDAIELTNHSEFLGIMPSSQVLAMYFTHDGGTDMVKWKLKGHAKKHYWAWVNTWAIMLDNPADIGFPMDGYVLPSLNIIETKIVTEKRDNGSLFNDTAISATNFNSELRLTKHERLNEAIRIAKSKPDESFIIWVKHNDEGEYLKKFLPDAIEVKGSDTNEWKEKHLLGFAENAFRILISKTKIASFGLNYQNCHNQIFASLDFSFEGLYQAMRRSYRFGQKEEVNVYLITTDTMVNVSRSIERKQKQFIEMKTEMIKAMDNGFKGIELSNFEMDTKEEKNEWYHIKRGDCVQLIKDVPDESIGLSVFSPPFADLFTYSSHLEDMGNSKDYKEFLVQFGFLVKELYRVIISGRNVAVHCMDLPIQKGKEGFIGLRDFSGMILRAFEEVGFIYASRVTIWKDPVTEMQRTKALGLLHKQIKKDSTMSRVGIPDYVLIFRKDGERNNPVTNTDLPVDLWQKYASPVWMDIDYGDTLQGYRNGKDEQDQKHICPLQLPTIERLIHLYSNKGDVVFSPFMGIGSEVFKAVEMGRIGCGFELKESYFDVAKKNLKDVLLLKNQKNLFDEIAN